MAEQDQTNDGAAERWFRNGATLAVGILGAYVLVGAFVVRSVPDAGALGDTFGPITGLLTAGAFLVAMWSVRVQRQELGLQRRELALQRQELQLQREEMKQSRAELAKAADAQSELANSQRAMVEAQAAAHTTAMYMEQATRRATVATLTGALADIHARRFGMATSQMHDLDRDPRMKLLLLGAENLANFELARLSEIAEAGQLGESEATRTAMTLEALAAWQAGLTKKD